VTGSGTGGPGGARPAEVAGVVLAAGAGTRLRPLTDLRPKALCPVGGVPLLDHALDRLAPLTGTGADRVAVNAHAHAGQVAAHCDRRGDVRLSVEPDPLGTAGALGLLRPWLDGRPVVVTNADSYLPDGLGTLLTGWDGERCRLLCAPSPGPGDFPSTAPGLRYVGAAVLPWSAVRDLAATPSGLYEVLWRDAERRGTLELVTVEQVTGGGTVAVDCGTPADYLRANLHASGGRSVVGAGATVLGTLHRCVVWDGAWVGPGEHLRDAVRAGTRDDVTTVTVTPG